MVPEPILEFCQREHLQTWNPMKKKAPADRWRNNRRFHETGWLIGIPLQWFITIPIQLGSIIPKNTANKQQILGTARIWCSTWVQYTLVILQKSGVFTRVEVVGIFLVYIYTWQDQGLHSAPTRNVSHGSSKDPFFVFVLDFQNICMYTICHLKIKRIDGEPLPSVLVYHSP